jgi:hypothetical protein
MKNWNLDHGYDYSWDNGDECWVCVKDEGVMFDEVGEGCEWATVSILVVVVNGYVFDFAVYIDRYSLCIIIKFDFIFNIKTTPPQYNII